MTHFPVPAVDRGDPFTMAADPHPLEKFALVVVTGLQDQLPFFQCSGRRDLKCALKRAAIAGEGCTDAIHQNADLLMLVQREHHGRRAASTVDRQLIALDRQPVGGPVDGRIGCFLQMIRGVEA
jgi:hypothetical protein